MNVLLYPTYFPNIAHFVAMLKADKIIFETCDNYQKQTYRNRASIYAANGKLDLNIPVIYSQKNRQLFKDVLIFNTENWQLQHLKSLESAYRTSPFFEFYIDDLSPLFTNKTVTLMEFNLKSIEVIFDCLQLPFSYTKTKTFDLETKNILNAKPLANSRKEIRQSFKPYTQVFDNKYDFLQNLSILDVLFNEGPNTELYLQNQKLNL